MNMRWLNTTSGFTALVGDDVAGTVGFDGTDWTAQVAGLSDVERFATPEAAKAWLTEAIMETEADL